MMTWKVELNIPLSTRAHEARVLFQPIKPELSPCYPHLNQDLLPTLKPRSVTHFLNLPLNLAISFLICLSISLSLSQSRYHLPHALNLPLSLTLALFLSLLLALGLPLSLGLALYSPSCSRSLLLVSVYIFSLESQGMSPYLNICLSIGYLWVFVGICGYL